MPEDRITYSKKALEEFVKYLRQLDKQRRQILTYFISKLEQEKAEQIRKALK